MKIVQFSIEKNKSVKKFVLDVLYAEGFYYDRNKDFDLEDIYSNYLINNGAFFIAYADDKIVGTCAVKHINQNKCEIKRLYVNDFYRRQYIGEKLLDTALKFTINNYKQIALKTQNSQIAAINLYFKKGFKIIKEDENIIYFEKDCYL